MITASDTPTPAPTAIVFPLCCVSTLETYVDSHCT